MIREKEAVYFDLMVKDGADGGIVQYVILSRCCGKKLTVKVLS